MVICHRAKKLICYNGNSYHGSQISVFNFNVLKHPILVEMSAWQFSSSIFICLINLEFALGYIFLSLLIRNRSEYLLYYHKILSLILKHLIAPGTANLATSFVSLLISCSCLHSWRRCFMFIHVVLCSFASFKFNNIFQCRFLKWELPLAS